MLYEPAYILAIVGGIVWGIRQEGRLNTHDLILAERLRTSDDRHDEVLSRFDRLERKIDQL